MDYFRVKFNLEDRTDSNNNNNKVYTLDFNLNTASVSLHSNWLPLYFWFYVYMSKPSTRGKQTAAMFVRDHMFPAECTENTLLLHHSISSSRVTSAVLE